MGCTSAANVWCASARAQCRQGVMRASQSYPNHQNLLLPNFGRGLAPAHTGVAYMATPIDPFPCKHTCVRAGIWAHGMRMLMHTLACSSATTRVHCQGLARAQ